MAKKYVDAGGCLLFKPRDGAPSWIARENGKFMVTLPDGTQLTSTITIGKANEKSKDCPSLKMQWVLEDAQASSDPDWMGDNGTAAPDDDIL